jgi:hypothetical protein
MHWNLLRIKKEVMFLSGIGYRDLVHAIITKGKGFQHSL